MKNIFLTWLILFITTNGSLSTPTNSNKSVTKDVTMNIANAQEPTSSIEDQKTKGIITTQRWLPVSTTLKMEETINSDKPVRKTKKVDIWQYMTLTENILLLVALGFYIRKTQLTVRELSDLLKHDSS